MSRGLGDLNVQLGGQQVGHWGGEPNDLHTIRGKLLTRQAELERLIRGHDQHVKELEQVTAALAVLGGGS